MFVRDLCLTAQRQVSDEKGLVAMGEGIAETSKHCKRGNDIGGKEDDI